MRTNTRTAGRQAMTGISRASMREMDDMHLMQQCKKGDVMHGETPTDFERFQHLGMTALPLDQDQEEGGGSGGSRAGNGSSGGGGNGQQSQQPQGKSAEAMMLYPNGDRSHPIAVCVDDRRVRPYGIEKGESAHYSADGSGQMVLHKADGVYQITRDGKSYQKNSDNQKRKSSLRHVAKDYQERKIQSSSGGSGSGSKDGSSQQKKQDHIGKVNTAVNCTATRIEFCKKGQSSRDGTQTQEGQVIGYHDQDEQSWWYQADKNHTIDCGQNTQFKASMHMRIGTTLRQGDTFTSGTEHAADHVAGGGASITPTGNWSGSGTPGTVSLLAVASGLTALEGSAVKKSGDTMTGPLTLSGNPTSALHAAPKQYVDAQASGLAGKVSKAGDTMTGILTLAADPVDALDAATKQYVDAHALAATQAIVDADGNITIRGNLTVTGDLTVAGVIRAKDFERI